MKVQKIHHVSALVKDLEKAGGALAKAERMRKMIENIKISTPDGSLITITASIGIGVKKYPEGAGMNKNQLIKEADKQLYRAKQQGRNRVCHA